jgi:hypothetical protein
MGETSVHLSSDRTRPGRRSHRSHVQQCAQVGWLVRANAPEPLFAHPFPFRVFLSHSSKDIDLVATLHDRVRGVGIDLYLAEHDVRPGALLSTKVQSAIERSHAVIVLLTEAAANSAYVQQEIGYALRCDRPVVPLVEAGLPVGSLAMLQGREFIPLNPADPVKGFEDAEKYLERLKDRKEWRDLAVALVVIGGIIFLTSGENGGASLT